jgi:hypothetical protein
MEGLDVGGEAAAVLAAVRGAVTWFNAYTKSVDTAESILDGTLDADAQASIYTSALADFLGVDSVRDPFYTFRPHIPCLMIVIVRLPSISLLVQRRFRSVYSVFRYYAPLNFKSRLGPSRSAS